MTAISPEPSATKPKGLSIAALLAGLGSLILTLIFFTTEAGAPVLWAGAILGLAGLILGIIALKKGQPKGMALTGLIVGSVCFLLSLAIFIFALMFVGAFTTESPYS